MNTLAINKALVENNQDLKLKNPKIKLGITSFFKVFEISIAEASLEFSNEMKTHTLYGLSNLD